MTTVVDEKKAAINLLASLVNRDRLSVFEHLNSSALADSDVQNMLTDSNITLNESGVLNGKIYGTDEDDTLDGAREIYGLGGDDGHDIIMDLGTIRNTADVLILEGLA